MKKKIFKVITIIVSVILVAGLSAAGVYKFYFKPKYADKMIAAADKILQDEEVMKILESEEVKKILENENVKTALDNDKIKQTLESDEAKKILESDAAKQALESDAVKQAMDNADGNSSVSAGSNETAEQSKGDNVGTNIVQGGTKLSNDAQSSVQNNGNAQSSVQNNGNAQGSTNEEKVDENKKGEDISAKEIAEGMKIASKIDVDRVMKAMSGNATPEEKSATYQYVKSTLSDEEIARLIVLASKYRDSLK